MNTPKRLNRIVLLIGIVSFVCALFLSGLNFGLGAGWEISYQNSPFFQMGSSAYQDMALRYFMISILILLSIVFFQARNKLFPQVIGLILLMVVMLQCKILIDSKPDELPDFVTDQANQLRLLWQIDFFLFAASFVLIVLQVYLIKLKHFPSGDKETQFSNYQGFLVF